MRKNDKNFKDKVVLITGASAGIGEAVAKVFAKQQAKLALAARRVERLEALVSNCAKMNAKAIALSCDVTKDEDLPACVEKTHQALGLIDVVIANAGFGVTGPFESFSLADFQRQFETNVNGVLRTIFATLEDLKKTKGRLVIVGSALGHMVLPHYTPYVMSKFSLTALAQSLYTEVAPYGISVTYICPGYVHTEFRDVDNNGVHQPNSALRKPVAEIIRMDVDTAAKIIYKAIRARKRECIFTLSGRFGVFIDRLFPSLLPWFFKRRAISQSKK